MHHNVHPLSINLRLYRIEAAANNIELVVLLEQDVTTLKSLNGGVNKVDGFLERVREAEANLTGC